MRWTGGATGGRTVVASLPVARLDTLIAGVVLVTAVGFRFLGERHLRDATTTGAMDLLIALEIVLIPLGLAGLAVGGRRRSWRGLLRARRLGWTGAIVAMGAALLVTATGPPAATLPVDGSVAAAAGLVAADEILRRGFLLNAIATASGGGRTADGVALFILAGGAAVGYSPGGIGQAVAAGAADAVLGTACLLSGRTVWAPVLARVGAEVIERSRLIGS